MSSLSLNDVDQWTELVVVEWVGDMVTRYIFYYYLLLTTVHLYGRGHTIRYARVRTPTATIFYSGRDGGELIFIIKKCDFATSNIPTYCVAVDKRGAFG